MSEVAGQSTAEKHEADGMGDAAPLHGNLDDIFDDDAAGYGGGGDGDDYDSSSGDLMKDFEDAFDECSPVISKRLVGKAAMPALVTSEGSKGNSKSSLPPPPTTEVEGGGWQDDVADIPHRRELIRQIAQLLRDRKLNPTDVWLKELPYKARKLEEQLYKTAESLQDYLEKATLKHRLKKVAHAITSQFRLAKGGKPPPALDSSRQASKRSSISSEITLGSMGRMSRHGSITSQSDPLGTSLGGEGDMSDLERQQQVNQKLQEQILENIRQQQQIMKNLMGSGGNNNNSQQQQGLNHHQYLGSGSNDMMSLAASNQMNEMGQMNSMGQMNQMASQMGQMSQMSQMNQMASQMGGMNSAMGLAGMNGMGNMNNGGGMNGMSRSIGMGGGIGVGMGNGMSAAAMGDGMGSGGMSAGMGMCGLGGGFNMVGMNASGVSPMLAQQMMQQQRMAAVAAQSSPSSAQMAMMQSFRNSLTGQSNPAAMNAAALMGSMSSVLPAPQLKSAPNSGTNPTMPPPSMNAVMRSSFTSGSDKGIGRTASEDEGRSADLSLSPNSFKW